MAAAAASACSHPGPISPLGSRSSTAAQSPTAKTWSSPVLRQARSTTIPQAVGSPASAARESRGLTPVQVISSVVGIFSSHEVRTAERRPSSATTVVTSQAERTSTPASIS